MTEPEDIEWEGWITDPTDEDIDGAGGVEGVVYGHTREGKLWTKWSAIGYKARDVDEVAIQEDTIRREETEVMYDEGE